METWVLLNKFIVIIYCTFVYSRGEYRNYPVAIIFILLYTSLNLIMYIIKRRTVRILLIAVSVASSVTAYSYIDMHFILLLPINIFDLNNLKFENLNFAKCGIVALVLALFINASIIPEYVLITLLSLVIFVLSSIYFKRLTKLTEELDYLRERNHDLSSHLHRGKEYEQQLKYMSQLEIRNKIAQEIHDKIGHTISGSLMQLEAAKAIQEKDLQKSRNMLDNVIVVLREGMESIRSTLRNIKPLAQQLGVNRLKLMLDEYSANNNIKSKLLYSGDLDAITYTQWKVIIENTSEALTNTLKYSKATTVSVNIEVLNKIIKTEVRDNGGGSLSINKGLGIRGIEERSEEIGGKVIIDGSRGFSVIVLLPFDKRS